MSQFLEAAPRAIEAVRIVGGYTVAECAYCSSMIATS